MATMSEVLAQTVPEIRKILEQQGGVVQPAPQQRQNTNFGDILQQPMNSVVDVAALGQKPVWQWLIGLFILGKVFK